MDGTIITTSIWNHWLNDSSIVLLKDLLPISSRDAEPLPSVGSLLGPTSEGEPPRGGGKPDENSGRKCEGVGRQQDERKAPRERRPYVGGAVAREEAGDQAEGGQQLRAHAESAPVSRGRDLADVARSRERRQ